MPDVHAAASNPAGRLTAVFKRKCRDPKLKLGRSSRNRVGACPGTLQQAVRDSDERRVLPELSRVDSVFLYLVIHDALGCSENFGRMALIPFRGS